MSDVSITDIARAAGVSPSTVSRALQHHPRISIERREAIQSLASELGYRPSEVARSLVTGRTRSLGVVVADITDPFVAEVMKGVAAASREAGYSLLLAMSNRDPQQEVDAAGLLADRQVDGMVVISSRCLQSYRDLLPSMRGGAGTPVVLVNNDQAGPHVHSVRMDNRGGAQAAVGYLWSLGHRRIAFVSGPPGGRSSRERLEGYRQGLIAHGLAASDSLISPGSGQLEDGEQALALLLGLPERPSGILCYNDLAAIGLMAAANARGLRVPQDLSVVGYDNIPFSAFTIPALTTVEQPKQMMGRLAVTMCLRALAGEPVSDAVLRGDLVVRGSADAPNAGVWPSTFHTHSDRRI